MRRGRPEALTRACLEIRLKFPPAEDRRTGKPSVVTGLEPVLNRSPQPDCDKRPP